MGKYFNHTNTCTWFEKIYYTEWYEIAEVQLNLVYKNSNFIFKLLLLKFIVENCSSLLCPSLTPGLLPKDSHFSSSQLILLDAKLHISHNTLK